MFGIRAKIYLLSLFSLIFLLPALAKPDLVASFSDVEALLDQMPKGKGKVVITIESFSGKNAKRISQLADRVEIWLGAKRIASMDASSQETVDERRRRIFPFPAFELEAGYYFFTVRLYRKGALFSRAKWNGDIFQLGVHPGKVSRIHKTIPFFLW